MKEEAARLMASSAAASGIIWLTYQCTRCSFAPSWSTHVPASNSGKLGKFVALGARHGGGGGCRGGGSFSGGAENPVWAAARVRSFRTCPRQGRPRGMAGEVARRRFIGRSHDRAPS